MLSSHAYSQRSDTGIWSLILRLERATEALSDSSLKRTLKSFKNAYNVSRRRSAAKKAPAASKLLTLRNAFQTTVVTRNMQLFRSLRRCVTRSKLNRLAGSDFRIPIHVQVNHAMKKKQIVYSPIGKSRNYPPRHRSTFVKNWKVNLQLLRWNHWPIPRMPHVSLDDFFTSVDFQVSAFNGSNYTSASHYSYLSNLLCCDVFPHIDKWPLRKPVCRLLLSSIAMTAHSRILAKTVLWPGKLPCSLSYHNLWWVHSLSASNY